MNRTNIINHLIRKFNYENYLEIGVKKNVNFDQIKIKNKVGVDPNPIKKCKYKITSDEFFKSYAKNSIYDIIFIDGLHLKHQVLKDIDNSLKHLSPNGTIVVHDCSPICKENAAEVQNKHGDWNGTVWEALAELRMSRTDLYICVIDVDHGCGIIRRGNQKLFPKNEINYDLLNNNRLELLNLKPWDWFINEDFI